jgi:SAM-dependent methyltransferase
MPALKSQSWNLFQTIFGAPDFKRSLYGSVLHGSGKLLDFGCATGHIAEIFSGFDYYGVDLDPGAIESAKARFRDHDNMHFQAVDIHTRPFPEAFFDHILFAGTAHHVTDAIFKSVFKELNFCLKPTGTLHLLDPVLKDTDSWQQRLMRRIDRGHHPRSLTQFQDLITSLDLFQMGEPAYHTPYGALIQDCDFIHIPMRKKTPAGLSAQR